MDEAFLGLARVAEASVQAKDAVLFWVYIIEWATVSATSAVVGVVVWALMVRKRLYREVEMTRQRHDRSA